MKLTAPPMDALLIGRTHATVIRNKISRASGMEMNVLENKPATISKVSGVLQVITECSLR